MSTFNIIPEIIEDMKAGKMVILVDDENRENEGDLMIAAEFVTPEAVNFMAKFGRGLICMPITKKRSAELDLPLMTQHNTEYTKCKFTISVDVIKGATTGISAHDRAATIRAILDPELQPRELARPGHLFPLVAEDGGVLVRAGQTEGSVDLCKLSALQPAAVICEILKDDGTMARRDDLFVFAAKHDLKICTTVDLIKYRHQHDRLVKREVETRLPTKYGEFQMYYYSNLLDDKEHLALVMGDISPDEPILVRMHSECQTGDVFSSVRCDCQDQLHGAMKQIAEEGRGVIVYLRQEGRGIGLKHKLMAYNLQDQGRDTVQANEDLGFAPDLRKYGIGAQILCDIGVTHMNLLTNNERKIVALKGYGLEVNKRIPLILTRAENEFYMQTKKEKLGHLL